MAERDFEESLCRHLLNSSKTSERNVMPENSQSFVVANLQTYHLALPADLDQPKVRALVVNRQAPRVREMCTRLVVVHAAGRDVVDGDTARGFLR